VSILASSSKVLEKIIDRQCDPWPEEIYNPYLAAFRRGYSCQYVFPGIWESWRADMKPRKGCEHRIDNDLM
jgi:hypothetical protein